MKKNNLIGMISEFVLAAGALVCLIISAVYGNVALIIASSVVMLALLYIAGGFLVAHLAPDFNYFGWVIWFWNVFCKEWVWQTFCKKWVWNTFCKGWFFPVFCKAWVWETFCVAWVWQTFCVKWIWRGFCVNLLYKKFDKWKAWLYLSPAIVLLLIFTVWPIFNTVKMAFTVYWDPEAVVYETDENGKYITQRELLEKPAYKKSGAKGEETANR